MALSCLLTKFSTQCFLRGQTLRTGITILNRSSSSLSNRDLTLLSQAEKTKNQLLQPEANSALFPLLYTPTASLSSLKEAPYKKHNHVNIWRLERIFSAGLLFLIPAGLALPSPTLDTIVAVLIVMHNHWGLEAMIVDYVRPILFGDIAPKLAIALLYVLSIAMLAGLLNLIHNDIGLANTIIKIMKS